MIVDQLELRDDAPGVERSARIRWRGGELRVFITTEPELAGPGPDGSAFVCACLLPAMRLGEDVEVDGPVSPLLMRGLTRACDLYRAWDPSLHEVAVRSAEPLDPAGPRAEGIGCFFSRGVDSTYSAAAPRKLPGPLERLVFADGLEPQHDRRVRAEEVRLAREVAARIGLPLTVVQTNVRELTDPIVRDWSDMAGGGLAFVANALGGGLGQVVVPSSDHPMWAGASGTGPLLDHLFSTEAVEIHHDSTAVGRVGKTLWLARERPDLARGLKVCFAENRPDNCGRCAKCLLTMVTLEAVGLLDSAEYFPNEIDLDEVVKMKLSALEPRINWADAARALDPRRHRALRDAVLAAMRAPAPPYPGRPRREDSPDFVARRSAFFTALARDGLPWPPLDDFEAAPSAAGSREAGLVRALDPRRRRHVYGVGKRPRGEPVGELGSLVTTAPPDGVPMFFTPEGYLVTDRPADAVRPIRTRSAAARWLLAPLSWRGSAEGLGARVHAVVRRAALLALDDYRFPSPPGGAPVGYLHRDAGGGRVPLLSAIHPITGDQLLTTNRWEATDLGYGEPTLLGHLEPSAPVTGRLGTRRPALPWASRFGQRVRD